MGARVRFVLDMSYREALRAGETACASARFRVKALIVAACGLVMVAGTPASAELWGRNTGPEGGLMQSLAIDPSSPNTLYAGTNYGGVFKTTNGGGNWTVVLQGGIVPALAIDPTSPSTVYAGAGGGVLKTTDGGGSWTAVNTGLPNTGAQALAIDPASPRTVYAGTNGDGVFKTTDGGGTWGVVNLGLTNTDVVSLAIDPASPSTVYAGTWGNGVFKTTDGGGSWTAVNAAMGNVDIHALAINPTSPSTVYAGTENEGLFKTTDGGASWVVTTSSELQNVSVSSLAIDPASSSTLYAGTHGCVFKTTDGGASWTAVNSGLINTDVVALAIDPANPSTVYAGSYGGGVFKTDGSGAWSAVNSGLINTNVYALAVDPTSPDTVFAGTLLDGVFKTTDRGRTWAAVNAGLANTRVGVLAMDPVSPSTLYVGTNAETNAGVFKTTNGGSSWTAVNTGLTTTDVFALAIDPTSPSTIYAGTYYGGVFKTMDGGGSWTAVNTGLPLDTCVYALAIDPANPSTLYAGTDGDVQLIPGHGVFKTTDGGGSWTTVNAGLTNTRVRCLAIDPVTPNTVYAGTYGDAGAAFKTTDGGASWTQVGVGGFVYALAIDAATPSTVYAGTFYAGVFKTTDGGGSWTAFNTGLGGSVLSLAIDPVNPTTVYAGMYYGGGVFVQACGDTQLDATEECDDGNLASGDGCSATCQIEFGWTCAGQPSTCSLGDCPANASGAPKCACDAGYSGALTWNGTNWTGICSLVNGRACVGGSECASGYCIDGVCCNSLCGGGLATDCLACSVASGGTADGTCTPSSGNACNDSNACTQTDTCQNGTCAGGNAVTCVASDQCHVAGTCNPADGTCSNPLAPVVCGDGRTCGGEQCDDGNLLDGDGCDSNCTPTACGNGIVTAGEQCDDGNVVDGDGCDSNCTPTACGNGIVTAGEQCDDGNAVDGDGCQADCTFTPVSVSQSVSAGGTVSTDTGGGATSAFPLQTAVTTPVGGTITINQTPSLVPPAAGFALLGMVVDITAPPASPTEPLQITLLVDTSLVSSGSTAATLGVTKNGELVPDCTGPAAQASPDPCVNSRQLLGDGDVQLVILTSDASRWAVVTPAHDTVVLPLRPVTLVVKPNELSATHRFAVTVRNADVLPKPETPGHTIRLTAATTCPRTTLSTPDFDPKTPLAEDSVVLAGGKSATATVTLTLDHTVTGFNKKAPYRCTVTFTAVTTNPSGSVDPVPSNNSAIAEVDVFDAGDAQVATRHESYIKSLAPVTVAVAKAKLNAAKVVSAVVGNADYLPTPEPAATHVIGITTAGGCGGLSIGTVDFDRRMPGNQLTAEVTGGMTKRGKLPLTLTSAGVTTPNPQSPLRCLVAVKAVGPNDPDPYPSNNSTTLTIDVIDKNDL